MRLQQACPLHHAVVYMQWQRLAIANACCSICCPSPGVHALACVVAFKLECIPDDFLTDPEGLAIVKVCPKRSMEP